MFLQSTSGEPVLSMALENTGEVFDVEPRTLYLAGPAPARHATQRQRSTAITNG